MQMVQRVPSPGAQPGVRVPWMRDLWGPHGAAVLGACHAGLRDKARRALAAWRAAVPACPLSPAAGLQPEQEALGASSPVFGEEEEEKDLNKALGVERFEEILSDAHPRNAEEAGRSYGEEDFECEWGPGAAGGQRAGGRQGANLPCPLQTTASRPTTSTTRSPHTCPPTPAARRG